jgi:hypothetical protein
MDQSDNDGLHHICAGTGLSRATSAPGLRTRSVCACLCSGEVDLPAAKFLWATGVLHGVRLAQDPDLHEWDLQQAGSGFQQCPNRVI